MYSNENRMIFFFFSLGKRKDLPYLGLEILIETAWGI